MARTRVWATEESSYTDNTVASSIDNKGTDLRVDVREVVNQIIGVAVGTALADPVVPATTHTLNRLAAAVPLTRTLCIPWQSFFWAYTAVGSGAGVLNQTFLTVAAAGDSNLVIGTDSGFGQVRDSAASAIAQTDKLVGYFGLSMIPVGSIITGGTVAFYRTNAADQMILTLQSSSLTTAGASTAEATVTTTGSTTGSMQTGTLGTIAVTTVADTAYRLELALVGGAANTQQRIYGCTLTYSLPTA